MTDIEMQDLVFRDLWNVSQGSECNFGKTIRQFSERQWRFDPDLESDLVEEVYLLAKLCGIRWYKDAYYFYDGRIYIVIRISIIEFAFKLWCTKVGLKISQKRKSYLCKSEFLEYIKISNHLTPRLDIVAFRNGILDLTDNSFNAFSPDYHVTYFHPYMYDPKAKCRKWQSFLKEVLPDKVSRKVLQMFLGLGLIERGTVYNSCEGKEAGKVEICLLLIGGGANGKSVIFETAMGIFGRNRISGIDYNELTMPGDEGMRARVQLRDAIFNWSSDTDPNSFGRKRTGVFKRIVSGEPVTDRKIGENVEMNYTMPYLIFNLNDLPDIDDGTLGFMRRLQIISFEVTIPSARQNKELAHDLRDEYPGIFNWVMRGMMEVKRKKYIFPTCEKSRRQMLLMQLKMNPVVAWTNAYRIRSEASVRGEQSSKIQSKYIIQSINKFCEDNDVDQLSNQRIGTTLGKLNFSKKRTSAGYEYIMYGVSEKDIMKSYVIYDQKYFDDEYDEENSYLEEGD